jgi:hypothetical protein
MGDFLNEQRDALRRLSSEEAANWLIEQYPVESENYGEAIVLLAHRSWKKSDQFRLARYYFRRVPFASSRPYEIFASFMSLSSFIKVIQERVPLNKEDRSLLVYHLKPVLKKKVSSASDEEMVNKLLSDLN